MFSDLIQILRRREEIIADHDWRDRDQEDHLQAIIEISGQISQWTQAHGNEIDARLAHYLNNASFSKALSHLLSDGTAPHHP